MTIPQADLATICRGAALELFQSNLEKVIANIKDPNTSATKKRTITLKVEFEPYADRSGANLSIGVEAKLQNHQGVNGTVFIRRDGPGYRAFTSDGSQLDMFDEQEAEPEPVHESPRKPQ